MRLISALLFLLFTFSILVSCNKEKSFEVAAPATGSLTSDATGDCLPKTAVGAFIEGNTLSDSNYLEIEVNVATAGSYIIRTDTINGYSFKGAGNFTQTGINRIRLAGSGTPQIASEDRFSVIYDASICSVPVTVLPTGSSSVAAFTLQGSGDSCMVSDVRGDYMQNVPLAGTNSVAIKINATATGTYTITTNTLNGFSFSGSGTLASLGQQTITLVASGTPAAEEVTVFTVSAGGTTCNFSVNVAPGGTPPPVTTGDYFPLSANSFWTYTDNVNAPEDSTVITNTGTTTIASNAYQVFEYGNGNGEPAYDTAYYRKTNGGDYYAYLPLDYYTLVPFDADVSGDILFLKENLQTNQTWNSAEFSGTASGIPLKVQFVFTCTDANASFAINGINYTNIYKVVAKPQISTSGASYIPTGEEVESYYAKGIGLIYQKSSSNGAVEFESFLLRYKVF